MSRLCALQLLVGLAAGLAIGFDIGRARSAGR